MTQPSPPRHKRKRPPPSRHGLLFGGDALYQVLAHLATERPREFTTKTLAKRIKRTPEHTRTEIDKLIAVGVIEEVRRDRKTRVYAIKETTLTKEMLDLPAVLVKQFGQYRRPRA